MTAKQRQRQREDEAITKIAKTKGNRPPGPPRPDLDARLANVARYVEPILAQNSRLVETHRFVSLVNKMEANKQIPAELAMAADRFLELYLIAAGPSTGVSSYGDFQPSSPPSQKSLTTDKRLNARKQFEAAFKAVFCVENNEGRMVIDRQLLKLVLPAILQDDKKITQGQIGMERTLYRGKAQSNAVGGGVVLESLQRLALHFQYKTE